MTGSSTLRFSVGTKTSLLVFSACPIRGAASTATPAPAALSRSRLRITVSSRVGVAMVLVRAPPRPANPDHRGIVLLISERALHFLRSTLVLLRPDVNQILCA